jgi:hypothetical protein
MIKVELIGGPFDGTKDYEVDTIGKPVEELKTGDLIWIPGPVGLFHQLKSVPYKLDREMRKAHYEPDERTRTLEE